MQQICKVLSNLPLYRLFWSIYELHCIAAYFNTSLPIVLVHFAKLCCIIMPVAGSTSHPTKQERVASHNPMYQYVKYGSCSFVQLVRLQKNALIYTYKCRTISGGVTLSQFVLYLHEEAWCPNQIHRQCRIFLSTLNFIVNHAKWTINEKNSHSFTPSMFHSFISFTFQ